MILSHHDKTPPGQRGLLRKMPTKAFRECHRGGIASQKRPFGLAEQPVSQGQTARFASPNGTNRNPLAARRLHNTASKRKHFYKSHAPKAWPQCKKTPAANPQLVLAAGAIMHILQGRPYSGMLPCFLGGLLWFLLRHISKARISLRRVSRGIITSSISPRSAVR